MDAAGDCRVATYGRRLLRVHGEVVTDETAGTLAEPCEIRGLLGTPDGSLWIGYAGQGLGRLKAGRFSRWRTGQGLHDDYICNILPELSLLGSLGVRPAIPLAQAQDYLGEVAAKSREMVAALDEIVWAVNPVNDLMPSVTSYLCHYAQRYFEATPVLCRLDVATGLADLSLNSEQRHGLLLALKEALNNVVRHSAATEAWLRIFVLPIRGFHRAHRFSLTWSPSPSSRTTPGSGRISGV